MEPKQLKEQNQRNNLTDETTKADQVEIVYYTDPLCCWSWAFEPQWRKLRYLYQGYIRWRYCMGGLLPGWKNFHDPVNSVSRPAQMGPVWMEANHISGMHIDTRIWMESPPVSSYLSCIAVKCAGIQSPEAEEKYLRRLREAVMTENRNISYSSILIDEANKLCQTHPGLLDLDMFASDLVNGRGAELFRSDLQETQLGHINRFPTFIMRRPGYRSLMISGYRSYHSLEEAFRQMIPDAGKVNNKIDLVAYRQYWGDMSDRELKEVEPASV